jgi:hypothetical protein
MAAGSSTWCAVDYTRDALAAVVDAMHRLATEPGHVRPDARGRWAVVGHSLGGPLGVNVALGAAALGLPAPRALMVTTPGDGNTGIMRSPAGLKDLLLLVVVGDQDAAVGEALGRRIFGEATALPPTQRNFILLRSDASLCAGHFGPLAIDPEYASSPDFLAQFRMPARAILPPGAGHADAFSWYGYWKWCDGLLGAAFYGADRAYALGDTPQQRFMGTWSDGHAVREPLIELPQ